MTDKPSMSDVGIGGWSDGFGTLYTTLHGQEVFRTKSIRESRMFDAELYGRLVMARKNEPVTVPGEPK